MENLNNIKKNSKVLDEIKYFAMVGYSVESVDFNNDKINLIRYTETTSHPFSLVNFKNDRLHMLSLSSKKPMNQITAMSNSIPAERVINNVAYDNYIKNLSEQAYDKLQEVKAELQNIDAVDFDLKSSVLYSHFKGVSSKFQKCLQNHLQSVRNVLLNAELCDESFLENEIKDLNAKQQTKTIDDIVKSN